MRKVILLMHSSLDGFVAGPNGEMDWIYADEELFDEAGRITDQADTALYGRVTYQMMEAYWPTGADQANATRHDIHHAAWVNKALKIVFSKTMKTTTWNNSLIIGENIEQAIKALKQQEGKNLLMIGSPSMAHFFMQHGLIDEYHIFVNPVILGHGMPLFTDVKTRTMLELVSVNRYNSGVLGLHYRTK